MFYNIFRKIQFALIVLEALTSGDKSVPIRPIGGLHSLEVGHKIGVILWNRNHQTVECHVVLIPGQDKKVKIYKTA